jgi:hypothetical protein
MNIRSIIRSFAWLWLSHAASAQVSGVVVDPQGQPLAFATIHVQGTSRGVTSNVDGKYTLPLTPGEYRLVFQYIGYEQRVETVRMEGRPLTLDIVMQPQAVRLREVIVRADAEDPAYAIIRKAIARRKYYRDMVERYQCDVYVKGNIKVLNVPEKLLGQEIGDLMGTLDSNRQGILYLSESRSRLYFQQPNQFKEEVTQAKVSGNDRGFGFNSASAMDFSLYENTSFLNRSIVSPIAGNALSYYNYRLEGAFHDQEGRLINKIALLPKRSEDPVYRGHIYIVEDLWLIQSADLLLTAAATKQPGLDSLWLKQTHVPLADPDVWRLFSQSIRFTAGFLSIKLEGSFTGVYSNYDLAPEFPRNFFDNEIYKMHEGANEMPFAYWDSIRPIPLTREEAVDYVRKDSIQEIRRSKPYLDSVDAVQNRFKIMNLFMGYTHNRSYERQSFSIGSPWSTIQFNTVQGFNADLAITYRRNHDELALRWFQVRPKLSYGFSERRLRGSLAFNYQFNQVRRTRFDLEGGTDVAQFNPDNPIGLTLNSLYSVIGRQNYLKLYDKAFGRAAFRHELFNGVLLAAHAEYARRSPLLNNSDYSWRNRDRGSPFSSNDPQDPENFAPAFEPSQAFELGFSLRLRYKQKYVSFPDRKFIQGSALPDLWVIYRRGLPVFGADTDYDHLALRISKSYVSVGLLGYFEFNLEGGTFPRRRYLQFMDYKHFNGNQTVVGNVERYLNSFMLLPYYERSTTANYFQAHWEHHFDGFITDRVPLLRKLAWPLVSGVSFLHTADRGEYLELNLGLENIGFGVFRFFRFDVVTAYQPERGWRWGWLIGLRLE